MSRSCGVCGARRGFIDGTNSPRLARLQSQALLFLIGWDRSGRWLRHRHGLRFRRGYRSPKLWYCAITSPQLSTLDLADEFAPHRFFRLELQQRLVDSLERSTLGGITCRKTNCAKNQKRRWVAYPPAYLKLPRNTACIGTIARPSDLPLSSLGLNANCPRRANTGPAPRSPAATENLTRRRGNIPGFDVRQAQAPDWG